MLSTRVDRLGVEGCTTGGKKSFVLIRKFWLGAEYLDTRISHRPCLFFLPACLPRMTHNGIICSGRSSSRIVSYGIPYCGIISRRTVGQRAMGQSAMGQSTMGYLPVGYLPVGYLPVGYLSGG